MIAVASLWFGFVFGFVVGAIVTAIFFLNFYDDMDEYDL